MFWTFYVAVTKPHFNSKTKFEVILQKTDKLSNTVSKKNWQPLVQPNGTLTGWISIFHKSDNFRFRSDEELAWRKYFQNPTLRGTKTQIPETAQFLTKTVSRKTAATVFSQTGPLEAEFQLSSKTTILDLDEARKFHEEQNFVIRH